VRAIDAYTYEIDIHGKYPQFKYWLAMPFFAPVPWEAMKFYAQPGLLQHNISLDWYPIGTGPYYLTENNPERRMIMLRNPGYHTDLYPTTGSEQDIKDGYLTSAGKQMPFIDKIIFSLEKESIPYWDKFLQGYYDRSGIGADNFNSVISGASRSGIELAPELLERKVRLSVSDSLTVWYWGFNMLDSTVGGYNEAGRKLRQAINLALDVEEFIVIFANGRGTIADGPIPPGIFGYEPMPQKPNNASDVIKAKQLLAEAGYPEGRHKTTGQPLQINFEAYSSGVPDEKARFAWLAKQLEKIDVELIVRATDYNRFMEKMANGDAQMYMWGWSADYPDPENFLFMFYSKNAKVKYAGENASNYNNPKFDALFEQFKSMDDTPERLALIGQMLSILREDMPWIWGYFPQTYVLSNPWAGKGKPHGIANNTLKYVTTDGALRAQLQHAWNQPLLWPFIIFIVIMLIIIAPAFIAHRRREHATAKRYK
jgi:oligopeptide transport system substrate-binding protein